MSNTPRTKATLDEIREHGDSLWARTQLILLTCDLEQENASLKALLLRIRREPDLLKRGGAGGQDPYAGSPPAYRLIDSELKLPWSA